MSAKENVNLWDVDIPTDLLNQSEQEYLSSQPTNLPTVEWVWVEMDRVWDKYGLNNKKPLDGQPIAEFYSHPVWLMNGVFTSLDPVSSKHRDVISQFITENDFELIADYAGGFGELAIKIAEKSPNATVQIIEPYPSKFGLFRLKDKHNIEVIDSLGNNKYDAVIAQDVLEHVEDPIGLAITLTESVKDNGVILFANCFYPVIKCHLPKTFHLRHTFRFVMAAYGLKYQGRLVGAEHVLIFKKIRRVNAKNARLAERISQAVGGVINWGRDILSSLKNLVTS